MCWTDIILIELSFDGLRRAVSIVSWLGYSHPVWHYTMKCGCSQGNATYAFGYMPLFEYHISSDSISCYSDDSPIEVGYILPFEYHTSPVHSTIQIPAPLRLGTCLCLSTIYHQINSLAIQMTAPSRLGICLCLSTIPHRSILLFRYQPHWG